MTQPLHILVCAICNRASCAQGVDTCGTWSGPLVVKPVEELAQLGLESPWWWTAEAMRRAYGFVPKLAEALPVEMRRTS